MLSRTATIDGIRASGSIAIMCSTRAETSAEMAGLISATGFAPPSRRKTVRNTGYRLCENRDQNAR